MSYALNLASYGVFIAAGCFALTIGAHELRLIPSHIRKLQSDLRNLKSIGQ